MKKEDWFRRTTWTPQDEEAFQVHLKRSRGDDRKAQYLRIQAFHLAEVGNHPAALTLLDQLFRDYPDPSELAQSFLQRAKSLVALGRDKEAIASFQASLDAQAKRPNMQTTVALEFSWYIATRRLFDLYDEAQSLIHQYELGDGIRFPNERFRCAAVLALIADDRGQTDEARAFAAIAHDAAKATHSGFRYHPTLGLVKEMPNEVAARLAAIRGGK